MTPEEVRIGLLAEVEAKLKEGLRDEGGPQTLSELEAIALKIGQAVKEGVMQELVAATPEPGIGKRKKGVVRQAGEVQVARDYSDCEGGRASRAGYIAGKWPSRWCG